MGRTAMTARVLLAAVIGAVVLAALASCPKQTDPQENSALPETPAVEPTPPEVTLLTEEDYPQGWSEIIDMPGADDPALLLHAERILYPSGVDRHCDELPYHAWEVFAARLEEELSANDTAFANWLMAQVQLKLWWCGPTDDPVYRAEEYARHALALAPDSACALATVALTDSCLNNEDEALSQINQAVVARPDLVYPLVTRGLIYRHSKEWALAIESYDLALAQNIRAVVINLYRGHVYWDMEDYESSLAAYERLCVLAPDYGIGHLNRGFVLYKLDRVDEAFDALIRTVECTDRISEAHRLLGTIHYERSEYEEARMALEWALMVDPENDNAHYYLGHYYYTSSLLGKAVDAYLRADELSPDEPETHCSLGKAYYMIGDYDLATPVLERAIELSEPGYWAHDEAVSTLAAINAPPVEPE